MLATVLHLMRGTPFIYQGEEIGMTNVPFTSIDQYKDIETLNMHRLHLEAGLSADDFIRGADESGRDNARTPMQWSAQSNAGFTTGSPWIEVNPNYLTLNTELQVRDDRSIWSHYRDLIALRKQHEVVVYGDYQSWLDQHPDVFVYSRTWQQDRIIVIANFRPNEITVTMPGELQLSGHCLISNYSRVDAIGESVSLRPYEAFALLCELPTT